MLITITPGDPEGIGPEIVLKSLLRRQPELPSSARLLCIGAAAPFRAMGATLIEVTDLRSVAELPRARPGEILFMPAPTMAPKNAAKMRSFSLPGYQSGWSIEKATGLVLSGVANALVTGPISKERLQRGGFAFAGHTEMLASLCRKKNVTMMLANEQLRISLVTTHIPLNKVSKAITPEALSRTIHHTAESLRTDWALEHPRIAVAALNPHAGEGGLFGNEEIEVIRPTLRRLQKSLGATATLEGPLPADTLFATNALATTNTKYDAVVCMYHDQGLIPVKLVDFSRTVNLTLGLPIIRTSVDHGVAFDLVGTGRADPSSFQSALRLAHQLAITRKENKNETKSHYS